MPAFARRVFLAHGLCLLIAGKASKAQDPGARGALVIGNNRYRNAPRLRNAVNDARLMARACTSAGFRVELVEDAELAHLISSLGEWIARSAYAPARFFYFAGHGAQYRSRNYLIPVDAKLRSEDDIPAQAFDVEQLIERVTRLNGVSVIVLDACRSRPEQLVADGRRRGIERPVDAGDDAGLALMRVPVGTLVAYAASPGSVASDSPASGNGMYARHLASRLAVPGIPIEMAFKQARAAVYRDSDRQQVPWDSSSLMGDFCFTAGAAGQCGFDAASPR